MGFYKDIGLKLTPQRLAILKYLENNREHPSAADIYKAVSKDFPTMSLATVYNTLRALKQVKDIQEISIDADKKRFDPETHEHNHLICVGCKKIVDVERRYSPDIPDAERQDFEILYTHVDFYGLCPECKDGQKRE
jgi:Fur family peroxide stress response transcriptional regulator